MLMDAMVGCRLVIFVVYNHRDRMPNENMNSLNLNVELWCDEEGSNAVVRKRNEEW